MIDKFKKMLWYLIHPKALIRRNKIAALQKKSKQYSDEEYIKRMFKLRLGYELNLDNPRTFNEKLQWLKLYNRKKEYILMSDKYLVRDYIAHTIGEEYLVPLIGVYDYPEQIDFDTLPDQFVLKCNHNSGTGMYICEDKSKIDVKKVRDNLKKGLDEDYFLKGREWPYKDIKRKIVCEKYLGKGDGTGLRDYKFYCFNGEPKFFLVSSNRLFDVRFDFFDIQGNPLPFSQGAKRGFVSLGDANIDKMSKIARKLSTGIPHVRIDLYQVDKKIYFGEMTFFDSSGFDGFDPKEWDYIFGDYLILPPKTV